MTRLHVLVGRAVSAILVYEPRIGIQLSDDGQERAEIRKFSAAFDMHRSDFLDNGKFDRLQRRGGLHVGPVLVVSAFFSLLSFANH